MSPNNKYSIKLGRTHKNAPSISIDKATLLHMFSNNEILQGHTHLITEPPPSSATPQNTSSHQYCPIPTIDKPSTNGPAATSFTYDQLRRCLGFRNIDNVIKHLPQTSQPTFNISTSDREPIIDLGDVSTIH